MLNFQKQGRHHPQTLLTMLLSASFVVVSLSLTPAIARQFAPINPIKPIPLGNDRLITAGTDIPVKYEQGEKILLTKQETFSLSLTVTDNIKNSQGQTIIPDGSQIIGEIKPDGQGSRFLSQKIFLKSHQPQEKSIDAISAVFTRLERIIKGVNPDKIIQGAVLGKSAASVLASFTSDRPISEGLLRGGGLEVLAGWLLRGESVELLSINPKEDLKLTLRSDFTGQ
ncbi:MAG: hypothetical protein DWQ51_16310 [Microcystis wesenbergii TW10]|uniref:Uncharacterized protein n=2 Tax=Microcystis TaxID=1125 RepID=A0A0A1W0X8_MICAE|nr:MULTISPECIES: hypothetical protein [Microcystis]MBD2118786.1 hypothetical protein [Microcystis wesenbergii FACHB-1339]REJ50028.1 MAG: hypothetical protein DWQ51_16310 [Microcystis wesenbergii TW10]GAL95439.1 conserved hypothetical protein [Microcystis aeruginosa NIES-44]